VSVALAEEPNFVQTFGFRDGQYVVRTVDLYGATYISKVPSTSKHFDAQKDFYVSMLNGKVRHEASSGKKINYIDLFCGGGGLSLGCHESLRALGHSPRLVAACDLDNDALSLVKKHFNPLIQRSSPAESLVKFATDPSGILEDFITQPEILDADISLLKGKIDLLVGGPPCQGHSNLNNHTRRSDERNRLYYVMPAFAVALNIPNVIIENVQSITSSREDVVGVTKRIFGSHGYHTEEVVLYAPDFGVAQTRKRHFLVAYKKEEKLNLVETIASLKGSHMTFDDVNADLPALGFKDSFLEEEPVLSQQNIDRINYLHDNGLYDLPNTERPDCHKDGTTYLSVYGRIHPDQPAPTITTGFNTPGRGRFVHPTERRVINAREAARIQGFPDWYWQPASSLGFLRKDYAKIIGDAVPPMFVQPIIFGLAPNF